MKIISIDLSETWGIKDPETGEEYEWEWESDEEYPALFTSSIITAVFQLEFPEDDTFTNDEEFTSKWVAFYEENQTRVNEDGDEDWVCTEDLIEEFDSPHFALELTTLGIACGPISSTIYMIVEDKYESQLDRLFLKCTDTSI